MREKSLYLKFFFILESALLLFLGIFYFSCGQTLYVRESNGIIKEFNATNDVGELTEGRVIEQTYTSQMDLVDAIGVMVSNYGKDMERELTIRCEDITENRLIAEKTFLTKEFGINQYIYIDIPDGMEVNRGNKFRVTCTSNGTEGDAPTVLYNVENKLEDISIASGAEFFINGVLTSGTMCIAIQGRDHVWTGPNYWKLVLLAVFLSTVVYAVEMSRHQKGKSTILFNIGHVFKRYQFLLKQLVQREFKVRYKRSMLGVFWSFLNPLLMMTVQYVVFSQLFKSDIDNYPVYLLSGVVIFNFFNEGVSQALNSIVSNASLITKVYIPKYIYPITKVLSSGINLLMSLIPLVIAALVTGEHITRAYLMLPYILLCVLAFTIGMGMILAAGMTFFRDLQFLWGVISMLWMYLTPLFYPISIIPVGIRQIIMCNPMYFFVNATRSIILQGITPTPWVFCHCTLAAIAMLVVGCLIFKKTQDKFIFYI